MAQQSAPTKYISDIPMKQQSSYTAPEIARLNQALAQTVFYESSTVAWKYYRLCAVSCDTPVVIIPLTGHKRFNVDSKYWECKPGQFLMSHAALQANSENFPDSDAPYRALVIPIPWEVVNIARNLVSGTYLTPLEQHQDVVSVGDLSCINSAILSYISDENVLDAAVRNYRLLGILLELFRAGHGQFLRSLDPSYSSRIRMTVSASPAREWSSAYFEDLFHLSGATLRRRLVSEGTSLRELIQDARLHSALMHLQTSTKPIKVVAAEHGYFSVPAFCLSFSKRFGVDPAEVANFKLSD